jgi:tetratricopeptide (TPR) repeat protein
MTMPFDDEPISPWSFEYWIAAALFFCRDWWASRPRGLWYLISATVVSLILFVFLSLVPRALHESTRLAYERRFVAAEKAENWAEAELWLQRMISMGDQRPVTHYHLAIVSERLGKHAETTAIMRSIAAESDFPPAHAWLAAQSLDKDATPQEITQAILHLSEAVRLDPDDARLHLALADAYQRSGKLREAANQVWAVAVKNHAFDLPLAKLYAEMGEVNGVRTHAALAEKYLNEKASKDPENEELVESIADSLLLQ